MSTAGQLDRPAAAPAATAPSTAGRARRTLAEKVAAFKRPRLALAGIVAMIYAASLTHPFLLDDYRNLRLLAEFQRGERPSLDLYRFLTRPDQVLADRRDGYLPWWVASDLRFAYFRPATEAFVGLEYRLFGANPLGYRLVGIGIYLLGLWMALALYRDWFGDELTARWAAVIYAAALCNVIPVTFIAAQCDLLAMIACLAAMLATSRFARGGPVVWLAAAVAAYGVGLLSKEAGVPAALLPAGLWIARRGQLAGDARRAFARRCGLTAGVFLCMAAVLIVYHGRQGYGSNGVLLLDPIHRPFEYLARMPEHVLLLLSSWLIPVNPMLTYLNGSDGFWKWAYMAIGTAALLAVGTVLWRRHRGSPAAQGFACWAFVFLPLLACTNPDNRVMMLPTVGLAALGALCVVGALPGASKAGRAAGASVAGGADAAAATPAAFAEANAGVARWPQIVFVFAPFMASCANAGIPGSIERRQATALRSAYESFEHEPDRADCIFVLNSIWQFDMLWCQDRSDFLTGGRGPLVAYLGHVMHVRPEVIDRHTLRLHAGQQPFFSPFLAKLGVTRAGLQTGARYDAGEIEVTLGEVRGNLVRTVDVRFRRPLDDGHYRFFTLDWLGRPTRWIPELPELPELPAVR